MPESPSPLLGKDILSKVRVSVFMNMELALSLPSTEQNLNLKCGPMEKQWSNTKCCPCHYQAQRLSPISTSKAIPTKACNEGLKHIIGNLREQGLLIPCNSPCNTPILGVKKSNDKWRLVQDLQIINEAVVPFTHMPKANGFSCLQVWADTFTGWIALPCCSEQAKEAIKTSVHESVPRFGLPRSLQSNNGSAFKAARTQGVSKALGIE